MADQYQKIVKFLNQRYPEYDDVLILDQETLEGHYALISCIGYILSNKAFSPEFMPKYYQHIKKYNNGIFNEEREIKLAIKTTDIIMKQGKLGDFDLQQITI